MLQALKSDLGEVVKKAIRHQSDTKMFGVNLEQPAKCTKGKDKRNVLYSPTAIAHVTPQSPQDKVVIIDWSCHHYKRWLLYIEDATN